VSELPRSALGAHPSVRAQYVGAIAPVHARSLPAPSRVHTRPRPRPGRKSASRAITVEAVRVPDAPPAREAAAEPWQPPIMKDRPTRARDGWSA
jgi:hypothetical protein